MMYRLDPAVPLVWRDPLTLQLGVDRVVCVFQHPSAAVERMLAALRSGAPRGALEVIAAGGRRDPTAEVDALLDAVAGALVPHPDDRVAHVTDRARSDRPVALPRRPVDVPAPPTVIVDGAGPTAERLARLLHDDGFRVTGASGARAEPGDPAAAVIVGSHVIPPWRHGPWLRRDVPHLPIVFGDDGARLGPFVDVDGPCLRCVSLARTEADPAWPAIAAQLDALPPTAEPALLSAQVVAVAARWVDARVRRGDTSHATVSIRLHPDGSVTEQEHRPHGMCGCRALPGNVTALVGRRPALPSSATTGVALG